MLVAAYLVGGFLIASVYAVGMLRGRRDRYHRLGFIIPFTVAAIATPIQMVVGDTLARWVYNNEPAKFAAIELVPEDEQRRARDAVRAPELERHRQRRHRDPGARVVPVRPERRHEHDRDPGPRTVVPTAPSRDPFERPTIAQVNIVHLAWDVMVGLGTLLFLLSVWYGLSVAVPPRHARRPKWFLRIAACAGVPRVVTIEAGWVVTEVGRQPWIVHNYMTVDRCGDDELRGVAHVPRRGRRSTRCSGSRRSSCCAGMSRRWRERRRPTTPTCPTDRATRHSRRRPPRGGAGRMTDADRGRVCSSG